MESGTEMEFVFPMVNAFPAIRGRFKQLCQYQEWKGNAAKVQHVRSSVRQSQVNVNVYR